MGWSLSQQGERWGALWSAQQSIKGLIQRHRITVEFASKKEKPRSRFKSENSLLTSMLTTAPPYHSVARNSSEKTQSVVSEDKYLDVFYYRFYNV